MSRPIQAGATDQSTVIRIVDSTTFLPEEAVEHNTSGIALWYRREGATITAITEAALAALDSDHADGGIEHIDDGYYRLDLPDLAVATGVDGVAVGGTVTGMMVIGSYHPLNFITEANIESECNDALVALGLDHLVSASVAGSDITDNSIIAKLVSKETTADWDDFVNTTDSMQGNRDLIDSLVSTIGAAADTDIATDIANVPTLVLDLANGIETGLTPRQAQRLVVAALAGKLSGAATTTVTIRNAEADSKDRIVATVDSDGNRSAITTDLT